MCGFRPSAFVAGVTSCPPVGRGFSADRRARGSRPLAEGSLTMKRWLPLVGLLGLLPLAAAPASAAAADPYVVVLKPGANPAAKAKSVGTSPSHIYKAAIDGYAANLSAPQLAKVKADPAVDYVVPDDPLAVSAADKPSPPPPAQQAQIVPFPVTRVGGLQSPTAKIDGVDERVDVDVAVLDSGIDLT